jgi:phosphoribosylformylglycinamidine synthase subunit PurL
VEYDRICELLEREPNHFELAVFSLLWSEHCGYKHSAPLLKRLPGAGARVLQGPGENAGVIDLGEGEAVAFKVESHNHPSAVEPFQGAATGVGGILRDIVAMGARPVALLDGLRFGDPGWAFRRAVAGIGHYGNCLAADERVLYRNSGQIRDAAIGDLCEERGAVRATASWTGPPNRPFQVLSIDPETHKVVWRDVTRVFKRTASRLLRIRGALGRSLTVTPDHPVVLSKNGRLIERPARDVRVGDRLPLLASLPRCLSPRGGGYVDLIDALDEPAIVILPREWQASKDLRLELRRVILRADARHYWLKRKELPVGAFKAVEALAGVPRTNLRLRLAGPRSTPVPAVFPLNRDVARLIGYYLSEGCTSKNGSTIRVIWTFGQDERERQYADDVSQILASLKIRHSVSTRASTVAISVSSRLLGRMLTDVLRCGSRSHEKRLPDFLISAPANLRDEVLKGIFRGDGCLDFPKRGSPVRIRHSTTSPELHQQLLLVLQSLGVFASSRPRRTSDLIQGRQVASRGAHELEFFGYESVMRAARWFLEDERKLMLDAVKRTRGSPFSRPKAVREGAMATVPVTAIEPVAGPAPVFDLEVPGTHLFATTGGIVTHNCVGVPTVGGESVFDEAYAGNCLVNAMCVGLLPHGSVLGSRATGSGNLILLYGATTGRDGIGGASVLASQELGEGSEEKRPSVQIGDPFTGKKLIEASLELVEAGLVESLQDCGAAGLASALAEMARGGAGVDVTLDHVPLREEGMEPWEIMISESQERMVAVVRPELLERVEAVLERWELHHAAVGEVTDTCELRAFCDGEVVGEIPAAFLTDECPRYEVERTPAPPASTPADPVNLEPKRWIYEQYDHLVQSRTVRRPGLDAAVLRLRPSWRGLAISLDGPPAGERDPFAAGVQAVLDAARNVACAGGEPLALTDCLNFGNPEKPAIGWELEQAIEGIAQAANALGIPVVSGNVSLYNETDGRAIPPTPVVGCVGLVPDVREVPSGWRPGDVVLLAESDSTLAGDAALIAFVWQAAPLLSLAHDVSDGGLGLALAEASSWSGAELGSRDEAPYGSIVLACAPERELDWPNLRRLGEVA